MTALIPAVRHALDVLGITPPGHRDTEDEVQAKLAAWTQLRDAVDAAERDLATSGVMTGAEVLDAVEAWCNHKAVEIGPPSDDVEYRMQAQLLTNLRLYLDGLREDL